MKLIKQFDETDCGAACLAMLASHFGSHLSITKIREVAGTDREGTSLKGMLEAAKKLNLDAKAVKGNEQIFSKKFPVPLIAHLQYPNGNNHFVVISKINVCIFIKANNFLIFLPPPKKQFILKVLFL